MTNLGKLQFFPHLLVTVSGFAFQWVCIMLSSPSKGWSIPSLLVSLVKVYLCTLMTLLSPETWSHLQQLSLVFQKLTQTGLKAKLTKCEFLKSCIEFLGYLVDRDGIHTVDSKITPLYKFPIPKSVENVHSFLGLAS